MSSYPIFQQTTKGGAANAIYTPVTFPSPAGLGNGIIVIASVGGSSAPPSSISLSDNNGNVYTPFGDLFIGTGGNADNAWQMFKCANIQNTPNATIAITVAQVGTGDPDVWALVAAEYSNTDKTNIVRAFASISSGNGISSGPVTLAAQPADTTAVGLSLGSQSIDSSTLSGPPDWTWRNLESEQQLGPLIADSANFGAGTISYTDIGAGVGAFVVVLQTPTSPMPWIDPNIEIHLPGSSGPIYSPVASATNVINYSGQSASHNSPGNNAATGNAPTSSIQDPDNKRGSNTVATANESQGIVLGAKSVKGRYDQFTVINNPA